MSDPTDEEIEQESLICRNQSDHCVYWDLSKKITSLEQQLAEAQKNITEFWVPTSETRLREYVALQKQLADAQKENDYLRGVVEGLERQVAEVFDVARGWDF